MNTYVTYKLKGLEHTVEMLTKIKKIDILKWLTTFEALYISHYYK